MTARASLLLTLFVFCVTVQSAEIWMGQDGVDVEGGSLGRFTLEYPALLDGAQKPAQKLAGKTIAGKTATLKYDGGAQIDAVLNDGKVSLKFSGNTANVKVIVVEMKLPIAFNQGGKWKIAATEGEFPKEKPANPHLHQGHASAFVVSNYEGKSLTLSVPENSFLQLTDNREWNWAIFNLKAVFNFNPEVVLELKASAGSGKPAPLVDALGQSTREDWPGKAKNLDDLKADVEAEKAYYDSLHPPATNTFGGMPGSRVNLALQATGFFHVEKKGNRWLLVDPSGDAFFHLGICSMNPAEDYTTIKGRESAYEWLPKKDDEFATAFRKESNGDVLSFHLSNMIRKYGKPYVHEEYVARMIARARKWGFNSVGAFSFGGEEARKAAQFPYVATLPLSQWEGIPRIPGIHETFDPFDDKTRAQIEANLAKSLPARLYDPLLIGYFIVNEPIYENIPRVVPSLNGTHACKRKLVEWLEQKYKTIDAYNAAWEAKATTFKDLVDPALIVKSPASQADANEFAGVFLDEYFKLVADNYRKHDKNHMLIGSRLQPGTINNEQLCRIMGKYIDVMSFNYYTYAVDKEFLRRIYDWTGGKPMMLSEFYWSAPKESGLNGGQEVASQTERGLAYRNYVEQAAALDFVIGIEWFTLVDQSATGRWFEGMNGERANCGLLSVSDRPWKAALEEMMKTNYSIYQVWLGEQQPFTFDHPKFKNAP